MIHLTGVRVLIWDVDGTFYPATEQVVRSVNDSAISSICEVMKWPREKAITEFNKVHGKITISQTEAVSIICNITTAEAANLTDKYLNRLQYIKKDPQLIALFEKLNNFQHYILGNGAQKPIEEGVKALGLNPSIFRNRDERNGRRQQAQRQRIPVYYGKNRLAGGSPPHDWRPRTRGSGACQSLGHAHMSRVGRETKSHCGCDSA